MQVLSYLWALPLMLILHYLQQKRRRKMKRRMSLDNVLNRDGKFMKIKTSLSKHMVVEIRID